MGTRSDLGRFAGAKNGEDCPTPVAWLSVLTNLALVGIKSGLAVLSGSLALRADAIHSLSDVVSSAAVLVGIKISGRQKHGFPYGLYKVENLVSLGISFLILFAGYEILRQAFDASNRPLPTQIPLAVAGVGVCIAISWGFSAYELRKGREAGSPSLEADAHHIRTDMLSSVVILTSLLGAGVGVAVDRLAAVVVVGFIGRSALGVFLDAVRVLLDASLDPATLDRIRLIALADPRVVAVNDLRARGAGRYRFVELDLTLRVRGLEKGHKVSEEIKQRVKDKLERVDHVQVHCQPVSRDRVVIGLPLDSDRQTLSEHFGEAPFFRLVTVRSVDGSVSSDAVVANPHATEKKGKGIKVAEWLLGQGLDLLLVRRGLRGKGAELALANAEAEVRVVSGTHAEEVLSPAAARASSGGGPGQGTEREAR